MPPRPHIYPDGSVHFWDHRVTTPVTFAQVTDTHLYPPPADRNDINREYRATSCNGGLKALNTPYAEIEQQLASMLDDIKACGVDFVSFTGDILDCYHPESARMLVALCAERELPAYFQMGNHDWDTEWPSGDGSSSPNRLPAQQYNIELRMRRAEKLMTEEWGMPGLYYSFDCQGVRFLSLDTIHRSQTPTWEGKISSSYDEAQADWLIQQLAYEGPIIIFQHVPFNPVTPEYRPQQWVDLHGGCVGDDERSQRVRAAVESCPNLLGIFVGHKHFCSEDPLGYTWQFMTGLAADGHWRLVKIANTPPAEYPVRHSYWAGGL